MDFILIIIFLINLYLSEIQISNKQICQSQKINLKNQINCWKDNNLLQSQITTKELIGVNVYSDTICLSNFPKSIITCSDLQNPLTPSEEIQDLETITQKINIIFGNDFVCIQNSISLNCHGNDIISRQVPIELFMNETLIQKVFASRENACVIQKTLDPSGLNSLFHLSCWGSQQSGINDVPVDSWDSSDDLLAMGSDTVCQFGELIKLCWGICTGGICKLPEIVENEDKVLILEIGIDNACTVSQQQYNQIINNVKAGKLHCWGSDVHGQNSIPIEQTDFITQISLGNQTTCGRKYNGSMSCWGLQNANFKELMNNLYSISTGGRHTCGARSGHQECWGNNEQGQTELDVLGTPIGVDRSEVNFNSYEIKQQISAGWDFSCYWANDEMIKCVGFNQLGQIDVVHPNDTEDGSTNDKIVEIKLIEAGLNHSCAIYTVNQTGLLNCWGGTDEHGQISTVGLDKKDPAINLVSVGHDFTCIVYNVEKQTNQSMRFNSIVKCQGMNDQGQSEGQSEEFIISEISAGAIHACILFEISKMPINNFNQIKCWGSNIAGQLQPLTSIDLSLSIRAGDAHTCIIDVYSSQLLCWGALIINKTEIEMQFIDTAQDMVCWVDKQNKGGCIGNNEWGECDVPKYGDQVDTIHF